ncbi:hypothetical protein B0J15DRAFT_376964, partial [Fusarium solani]
ARYGIPRSALQDQIAGTQSRQKSHEWRQKLSKQQEEKLRNWVLAQDSLGFPPTHAQV